MSRISPLTSTEAQAIGGQNGIRLKRMLDKAFKQLQDQVTDLEDAIRELAWLSSYTTPTNVVTAADVGSDCTITIATHTRVYPGSFIDDLSVAGGTITAQPFSTEFYVYYDDPDLTDTTPTYLVTTTAATAQVGAAPGRHFVGVVTTPANGAPPSTGGGGAPPGGNGGNPIP